MVSRMFRGYNYAIFAEKKSFAYLLTLLVIAPFLAAVPSQVFAQFAGGSGTSADPYQVATADQLNAVRSYRSSHFIQTADIDLGVAPYSTGTGWVPIGGAQNAQFHGEYNGNHKKITNLRIDGRVDYGMGLFGITTATAKLTGIILENIFINSGNDDLYKVTGGLVGINYGLVNECSATGEVTGITTTGGLVGYNIGTIQYSWADVKTETFNEYNYVNTVSYAAGG